MIKIDYINGTVEDFTVVLSNRNLDKQGQILNVQDFNYKGNLASAHEISFSVYKYVDEVETNLWKEINNLKIVWVKELDMFYETRISLAESTNIVKKITGISLCEAELSQTPIRNTEINSEDDIARPDYVVTKFYNPNNKEGSLLHRILSVVPHYSIKHVDESLWDIQRTFSIDGTTVYDFLMGELSEQIGCLFQFDSKDRSISVYDLCTVCSDCGYRGEYLDVCPECGSENLYSYGEDTTIFVSADNLTDKIAFDTDVDAIKNCFYLKTGDEVMDAAVIACNPNGSPYLYYFSEEQKTDMPDNLRNGLSDYDALVESYVEEYQQLSEELYECIDDILYYQSGMMPTVEIPEVNAQTEASKLTVENLSPVGLSTVNSYTSTATVNSALKNFANVFVKSGFVKVEIESGIFTYTGIDADEYGYGTWKGKFKITNYSDEEDIAYSDELTIKVTDDYETFLNQKVLKNIASNNTDDDSVFDVLCIDDLDKFKQALTLYSYNRLESFADAIQGVINVLIEENQGQSDSTYYGQLYTPYYNKLQACQAEMNIRATTIENLEKTQTNIIKRQSEIQSALNLQDFLGEDLYKLFCAYRREDTYQNDNFISDGLSNEEIFEKAKEFIELAKNEIVKSGEHQHSISSNLYNLLVMKEFVPIKDKFGLGNWIRCKVDDNVYRLRLVSYEINGNSLSNINTEFSELTKTANGVNDVKNILDKAQSMATSYQYVSKQAEQGKKAQDTILNAEKEGVNSAHMNIMNSPEQETVFGKYGILCRTKDETGEYSPEQSRITNNIWAFTNDNWKSVTLGLGKHDYHYYDDNNVLQKDTGYGLSSKFVQAGYVWGSQIIGGKIYSENYSPASKSDFGMGTYFDLNKGSFSMAGGRLIYDGNDEFLIKGVNITWEDIEGAEEGVTAITKNIINQDYINALDVTASSVTSTDGVDKCDIKSGYALFYKNNIIHGGIGANTIITGGKTLKSMTIRNYSDVIVFSHDGSSRYIINPNNCELTENNYTETHYFKGTGRFTDALTATSFNFINGSSLCESNYLNKNMIEINNGLYTNGDLCCVGKTYKTVNTNSKGLVGMNLFGTAEPYFADFGSGVISEEGFTTIAIDEVFLETIDVTNGYQVFITSSSAQTYIEKGTDNFIIHGDIGTTFDWMICAKQKGHSDIRIEQIN